MVEDERIRQVQRLLSEYTRSPSLRHIRDAHSIHKIAVEIVRCIDRRNSIWTKWDGQREQVLRSSLGCWVPIPDLREFLNGLPGPALTLTDVQQRLTAMEEEDRWTWGREELRDGCLEIYHRERAEGTELPAIIGMLREHVENEEQRLRAEQEERWRQTREEERQRRERRLFSGADCGWTQLPNLPNWFCRTNGRAYRLSPTKDRMWDLARVESVAEDEPGHWIGKYRYRRDATKIVARIAYEPEPI